MKHTVVDNRVFFYYIVSMIIHAVAAVIVRPGAFLAVRRKLDRVRDPGVWEFPGGKIEPNETKIQALHREVKEELGVTITHLKELLFYPFHDGNHTIHLTYWMANLVDDDYRITLSDHDAWKWFTETDFNPKEWLAGDEQIMEILKKLHIL
jgi:8-oxo-dGTP diphosphatase